MRKSKYDYSKPLHTEDSQTGCWIWDGHRRPDGYGVAHINGATIPAHRHYYRQYVGEIPDGYVVHHECENPRCVNPSHLKAVTQAENCQRGRNAKLTKVDATTIRALHSAGIPQRTLALQYGVSQPCISMIMTGKKWPERPAPHRGSISSCTVQ